MSDYDNDDGNDINLAKKDSPDSSISSCERDSGVDLAEVNKMTNKKAKKAPKLLCLIDNWFRNIKLTNWQMTTWDNIYNVF